jgi:hypothetical protein
MIRALLCLLALATPAGAFQLAPFKLAWPVDCTLGQTCHIQHYVGHDPGPGERDFTCGTLSYDGHDGTDIALPNRAAMAAGVKVLATAPGRVLGARDGVEDFVPPVPGKECGNGVLVDDGDSSGEVIATGDLHRGSLFKLYGLPRHSHAAGLVRPVSRRRP